MIDINISLKSNVGDMVTNTLANDCFDLCAKMKIESSDDGDICIKERLQNIWGWNFCQPTAKHVKYDKGETNA